MCLYSDTLHTEERYTGWLQQRELTCSLTVTKVYRLITATRPYMLVNGNKGTEVGYSYETLHAR